MAEVKVLEVRKVLSTDPGRVGKMDTIVVYNVDNARVSFIVLSKDPISETDIAEAVKKEEKGRTALVGKTFKVE